MRELGSVRATGHSSQSISRSSRAANVHRAERPLLRTQLSCEVCVVRRMQPADHMLQGGLPPHVISGRVGHQDLACEPLWLHMAACAWQASQHSAEVLRWKPGLPSPHTTARSPEYPVCSAVWHVGSSTAAAGGAGGFSETAAAANLATLEVWRRGTLASPICTLSLNWLARPKQAQRSMRPQTRKT